MKNSKTTTCDVRFVSRDGTRSPTAYTYRVDPLIHVAKDFWVLVPGKTAKDVPRVAQVTSVRSRVLSTTWRTRWILGAVNPVVAAREELETEHDIAG
jgi:hypothetical protein